MEKHGSHKTGTTDTSYTFEKLKDNETYTGFKMKAVDYAGNEIITEKEITVTLPEAPVPHVGDYVDYQPDTVTAIYKLEAIYSGYTKDQEISQDTLKWQILKIYEDGSMDLIGSPTTTSVYFKGALGYNNGVYLLHDICKELYSKPSEGIEARSVKLEDFEDEDLIKDGAKWKEVRDAYTKYGVKYGETKTYTGTYSYYPNLYAREIGAGINKEEVNKEGLSSSEKGYDAETTETYSPQEKPAADNSLTITNTRICFEYK